MITLRQMSHTQTGKPVYYLDDPTKKATYPLRNQLGRNGLGMQWWGAKAMWYTYHLTPTLLAGLKKLGVDTSAVEGGSASTAPNTSSANIPVPENVVPKSPAAPVISTEPSVPDQPLVQVDKEWPSEKYSKEFRASEKGGFPVKKGIYVQNVTLDFQGQQLNLTLSLNRKFMPGKTSDEYNPTIASGWKGFPIYEVEVLAGEKLIHAIRLPLNRKAPEKRWQQVNESSEIVPQMETMLKQNASKTDTKTYQRLLVHVQVTARDPEFVQFIADTDGKLFDTRDIQIPFENETYTLPVAFKLYVPYSADKNPNRLAVEFIEALDRTQYPGAPKESFHYLEQLDVPLTVRSVEELKQWTEGEWNKPEVQQEIIRKYQEYLKSFPFTAEKHRAASGNMGVILSMLVNDVVDVGFFKKKLVELGYMRPSMRQGRPKGIGMEPESQTVYVLDHNKITNDIYHGRGGISSNDPQYFYTCMAYYLHRLKKNIQSFSDIMLTTSISQWEQTGRRYGLDLHWREVYDYFDKAARQLFREIFGENAPRSWSQNYADFYGSSSGSGEEREAPSRSAPAAGGLDEFVNFAVSLGADAGLARTDPKKVYRQLAIKFHPDLNPDPQATVNFKRLANLWSQIENTYRTSPRTASNWLQKIHFSIFS